MTEPMLQHAAMTPPPSTENAHQHRAPLTRRRKILIAATVLALHVGMFLIYTGWSFAIAVAVMLAADRYDRKCRPADCQDTRLIEYILAGMCAAAALAFVAGVLAIGVLVMLS